MKKLLTCRRTVISALAILVLGVLGYFKTMDVAMAISTVAVGLSGANAYQGKKNETTVGES